MADAVVIAPIAVAALAPLGNHTNSGGTVRAANTADPARHATNTISARAPACPAARTSEKLITLRNRSDIMSGISVIRMALTQTMPIGSTVTVTACKTGLPKTEITA